MIAPLQSLFVTDDEIPDAANGLPILRGGSDDAVVLSGIEIVVRCPSDLSAADARRPGDVDTVHRHLYVANLTVEGGGDGRAPYGHDTAWDRTVTLNVDHFGLTVPGLLVPAAVLIAGVSLDGEGPIGSLAVVRAYLNTVGPVIEVVGRDERHAPAPGVRVLGEFCSVNPDSGSTHIFAKNGLDGGLRGAGRRVGRRGEFLGPNAGGQEQEEQREAQ